MLPHDDVGVGPAVVLLHAGVADRRMWADLLPSFAAAGYRAIAVDLPGFGDAADPGYAAHASVLDTMDALDVERAALIGNSFGRAVALRVAVVAPSVWPRWRWCRRPLPASTVCRAAGGVGCGGVRA